MSSAEYSGCIQACFRLAQLVKSSDFNTEYAPSPFLSVLLSSRFFLKTCNCNLFPYVLLAVDHPSKYPMCVVLYHFSDIFSLSCHVIQSLFSPLSQHNVFSFPFLACFVLQRNLINKAANDRLYKIK